MSADNTQIPAPHRHDHIRREPDPADRASRSSGAGSGWPGGADEAAGLLGDGERDKSDGAELGAVFAELVSPGEGGIWDDSDMTIRVLVADDQAVVRAGFRVVLGSAADIEVVGEAADGLAAAQRAATLRPDVVLMDVQMPGCDGIEATRRIAALDGEPVRVLVVTTFDLDDDVYEALRAGASGFVLKDVEPDDLVTAVRTVHTGHALLSPAVTGRLIREFLQASPGHGSTPADRGETGAYQLFTQREREVLSLLVRGMSNSEIAEQMYVAETTVKTHVGHMLRKLGLRDRVQLVVFAFETGLAASGPG